MCVESLSLLKSSPMDLPGGLIIGSIPVSPQKLTNMHKETFNELLSQLDAEKRLKVYNALPWYKKLLVNKPEFKNNIKDLALKYVKEFNQNNSLTNVCLYYNNEHGINKFYPVLHYTFWVGGCCIMSRRSFSKDGSWTEWGISYPHSECGVTFQGSLFKEYKKEAEELELVTRKISDWLQNIDN